MILQLYVCRQPCAGSKSENKPELHDWHVDYPPQLGLSDTDTNIHRYVPPWHRSKPTVSDSVIHDTCQFCHLSRTAYLLLHPVDDSNSAAAVREEVPPNSKQRFLYFLPLMIGTAEWWQEREREDDMQERAPALESNPGCCSKDSVFSTWCTTRPGELLGHLKDIFSQSPDQNGSQWCLRIVQSNGQADFGDFSMLCAWNQIQFASIALGWQRQRPISKCCQIKPKWFASIDTTRCRVIKKKFWL